MTSRPYFLYKRGAIDFFYHEQKFFVEKENPDWDDYRIRKEIQNMWFCLSGDEQKHYYGASKHDKLRFHDEVKVFQQNFG